MKLLGAMIVILGCGGFGFHLAASYRREERILRQLGGMLDYMGCELQYHMTPLPELCRQGAQQCGGILAQMMRTLSEEMESQISPDAAHCMSAALAKTPNLPPRVKSILKELGGSLGRFDLPGQLQGLERARQLCRREQEALNANRDVRLRSIQTLGLCAGAALAILFL